MPSSVFHVLFITRSLHAYIHRPTERPPGPAGAARPRPSTTAGRPSTGRPPPPPPKAPRRPGPVREPGPDGALITVACVPGVWTQRRRNSSRDGQRPAWKSRWLRTSGLPPAGSPEASLSAKSCSRLPQAPASLGQPAAPAGHTRLVFRMGCGLRRQRPVRCPRLADRDACPRPRRRG